MNPPYQNQNYYPISVPSAVDNAQPSWLLNSPSQLQDGAPGDKSGGPFLLPSIYPGWSLQDDRNSPFQQLQQPSKSDPWVDVVDKRSGQIYYWNTQTHETTSLGARKPSAVVVSQQQSHLQSMIFAPNQMNNAFVQPNYIPYGMNHNTNYTVYADKKQSHMMIQNKTFNNRSSNSSNTHIPRSKNYYGPTSEANSIVKRKLPDEADGASSKRQALSEDNSNPALRYKCSYCSKLFKKLVGLEAHIKIVHPSDVSTLTFPLHEDSASSTGIPFTRTFVAISPSTIGSNTNTATPSVTTATVAGPPGVAEFQCFVCKKNFKSSIALHQHSAANHVEDPASVQPTEMPVENGFHCLQCSKNFSNSVAMGQHFLAKHGIDLTIEVSTTSRPEDSRAEVALSGGNAQDVAPNSRSTVAEFCVDITGPAGLSSEFAMAGADIHVPAPGDSEVVDIPGLDTCSEPKVVLTMESTTNETEGDIVVSGHPSSQLVYDESSLTATTQDLTAAVLQGVTDDMILAIEGLQNAHSEKEATTGDSTGATEGHNSSSYSGAAPTEEISCTLCNKKFKWPNHLKQHCTMKHQGCVTSPVAVSSHSVVAATPNSAASANIIESPGSDDVRCKLCNKKLKNSVGLQQHLAMKHSMIE